LPTIIRGNTFSADVEHHGLLVAVLVERVGSSIDKHAHHLVGFIVVKYESREVKCRLAGLQLQPAHKFGGVLIDAVLGTLD